MNKKVFKCEIINGVRVTTYEDGLQSFEPVDQTKTVKTTDNRSWWQKLKDWWNDASVTPYVKVRDLADPLEKRLNDPNDYDVGSDGKNSIEAGIKIKF